MVINLVIPHLDHVMEMIEKNIFRPLPLIKKTNAPSEMGMEEEEVILDPSWPHLQVRDIDLGTNLLAHL
jgi:serine/threonine-protein phosphatase 2A regulatory subunit B'